VENRYIETVFQFAGDVVRLKKDRSRRVGRQKIRHSHVPEPYALILTVGMVPTAWTLGPFSS
jgi:hypothetical protein